MSGTREPSMSHLAQFLAELRDNADLTVSCFHCDWSFSGTALDARLAAQEHRKREHRRTKGKKGRRRR